MERVRIVRHQDTGNVKMMFVDFDDEESLRNCICMDKPFRDRPVALYKASFWKEFCTESDQEGGA